LQNKEKGVSHCGLAIYIKRYLKAKEENYEKSNIFPSKNIILKNSSKKNQNPSRYYNSITSLKFQHKPKYHLHIKIDLLPRGQNPLSYIYFTMNVNTISLPTKARPKTMQC